MFKTTSNEAYSVVKRQTGRGGGGGGGGEAVEYEIPQNLPPPTSSQPTTTAVETPSMNQCDTLDMLFLYRATTCVCFYLTSQLILPTSYFSCVGRC